MFCETKTIDTMNIQHYQEAVQIARERKVEAATELRRAIQANKTELAMYWLDQYQLRLHSYYQLQATT